MLIHEKTWKISTLLAGSTQVSKRVTWQEGLTRVGSVFHVNAYRELTEGLPIIVVIQPGLETNLELCKEALSDLRIADEKETANLL